MGLLSIVLIVGFVVLVVWTAAKPRWHFKNVLASEPDRNDVKGQDTTTTVACASQRSGNGPGTGDGSQVRDQAWWLASFLQSRRAKSWRWMQQAQAKNEMGVHDNQIGNERPTYLLHPGEAADTTYRRKGRFLMSHYASLAAVLIAVAGTSGCSDIDKDSAGEIRVKTGGGYTIRIELSDSLTEMGLTATAITQSFPQDGRQQLTVYFVAAKELSATLIAKAYNDNSQEIGRAIADATFHSDDGRYISFKFPSEMTPDKARVYKIDLGEKTPHDQP